MLKGRFLKQTKAASEDLTKIEKAPNKTRDSLILNDCLNDISTFLDIRIKRATQKRTAPETQEAQQTRQETLRSQRNLYQHLRSFISTARDNVVTQQQLDNLFDSFVDDIDRTARWIESDINERDDSPVRGIDKEVRKRLANASCVMAKDHWRGTLERYHNKNYVHTAVNRHTNLFEACTWELSKILLDEAFNDGKNENTLRQLEIQKIFASHFKMEPGEIIQLQNQITAHVSENYLPAAKTLGGTGIIKGSDDFRTSAQHKAWLTLMNVRSARQQKHTPPGIV